MEGDRLVTTPDFFARLGAEHSAARGHTIRDWTVHPAGDRGWTIGARDLYGVPNIVIDPSGHFIEYRMKSPDAALAMLAEQVAARGRETPPTDPGTFLRVDRLGWEFVFRQGDNDALEMWSTCDQEWQPADLLVFFSAREEAPLVPLSTDIARDWLAWVPQPAPTPDSTYYRVGVGPASQLLWRFAMTGLPELWRRRSATDGSLEVVPPEEIDALRASGQQFEEITAEVFREEARG
jgi:hypothetical protein